ncbi:SDR family NAD(P)-dependent oxidoreductase [Paenibacillus periandrae]|uniref:SDR family NAD(P)-dependent oxidoreductase n=1 Tax=Paenibacillus periandrae TaxID=1761741 RepID=UPI001F090E80|nr:SDR family oxidoreductase [Paenibacillus periandrae]
MKSLFDLSGKVALITGASRGIGLAVAEQMARHGAVVVLSSNDEQECRSAQESLRNQGYEAYAIPCDVSSKPQLETLVAESLSHYGRIDILVCNAGIGPHSGPIATATDEHWEQTMTVNLRSALWLTNRVIPQMAERNEGSVILMSSISSVRGNRSIGLYGLSKAGLAQLARNLAVEWGPRNIHVNAISPGLIQTEFAKPMLENPSIMERRLGLTPLRRAGTPDEIAGIAVMLASAAGAFVTGQNLIVDGGTTISDGN